MSIQGGRYTAHNILFPVVIVLVLAAGMRLTGAAQRPVWTDEGWSIWATGDPSLRVMAQRLINAPQPPLYYIGLSSWRAAAGESRIALRFPSIVGGLITVALVYRIGADVFGHRAALYGSLLFASLRIAVYYSQDIRYYGWLAAAVCVMSLFFVRYLHRPSRRRAILYALSVIAMLYTMYLGLSILAAQVVVGLAVWRGGWRAKAGLVGAWIVAASSCAPWAWTWLKESAHWMQSSGLKGSPFTYDTSLDSLVTLVGFLLGGQIALLGAQYGIGLWEMARRRDSGVRWTAQTYVALAGIGVFAGMALLNLHSGILATRTIVYLTPMLMLVCGYGLSILPGAAGVTLAAASAAALGLSGDVIQPRLDYPAVARAVAAAYTSGDPIILETGQDDTAFMYELSLMDASAPIIQTLPWVNPLWVGPDQELVAANIAPILETARRVWIVQWLQASQVIPYLEGETDFRQVLRLDIPTGDRYAELFPHAPVVQAVLFERPDAGFPLAAYGDDLTLVDALFPAQAARGGALHVDLWWSARQPTGYVVSVGLLQPGRDMAGIQHRGALNTGTTDVLFDRHTLPVSLEPGIYRVIVQVYGPGSAQLIPVGDAPYAVVGQVEIR